MVSFGWPSRPVIGQEYCVTFWKAARTFELESNDCGRAGLLRVAKTPYKMAPLVKPNPIAPWIFRNVYRASTAYYTENKRKRSASDAARQLGAQEVGCHVTFVGTKARKRADGTTAPDEKERSPRVLRKADRGGQGPRREAGVGSVSPCSSRAVKTLERCRLARFLHLAANWSSPVAGRPSGVLH